MTAERDSPEPSVPLKAGLRPRRYPQSRADDRSGAPGSPTALLSPSYLYLGAELDDAIRRNAEELGRPCRNAYEAGIEALAPPCHPRLRARFDIGAADKEGQLARIEF
jgi:hypothetical protein